MRRCLLVVAGTLSMAAWPQGVDVQPLPRLGPVRLHHVAVIVNDEEHVAKLYGDVLGVEVPPRRDGSSGEVTLRLFQLPDFLLEVNHVLSGQSPFKTFLDTYGEGVEHMGFTAPDWRTGALPALLQRGGTITVGTVTGRTVVVDVKNRFGLRVELTAPRPVEPLKLLHNNGLGSLRVDHVGVMVPDIEQASRDYADLLATPVPSIRTMPVTLPPGVAGDPSASARITTVSTSNMFFELVEPIGDSPFRAFLNRFGMNVHHVAFRAGDRQSDMVAMLLQKGGRLVVGGTDSASAYVDMPGMALTIEVMKGRL